MPDGDGVDVRRPIVIIAPNRRIVNVATNAVDDLCCTHIPGFEEGCAPVYPQIAVVVGGVGMLASILGDEGEL
jgi:hypothetical protein